jgi:hypothetical protein
MQFHKLAVGRKKSSQMTLSASRAVKRRLVAWMCSPDAARIGSDRDDFASRRRMAGFGGRGRSVDDFVSVAPRSVATEVAGVVVTRDTSTTWVTSTSGNESYSGSIESMKVGSERCQLSGHFLRYTVHVRSRSTRKSAQPFHAG